MALGRRLLSALPSGVVLPRDDWERRHRWILGLVLAHVPALVVFGILRGQPAAHAAVDVAPIFMMALLAGARRSPVWLRSVFAAVGLMLASAVLVHMSGGVTEMH